MGLKVLTGVFVLAILSGCAGLVGPSTKDRSGPPPENNWQAGRAEANKLGDAADAGDKAALATLTRMATGGHAAAAHNLGWYYSRRKNGRIEDNETSCAWYRQSSGQLYVPSMHAYAFRCLMPKTPRTGASLEKEMVQTLLDAAHYGWVPSSIYVAEYMMNSLTLSQDDADAAMQAVKNGLKSNPNPKEKVILNYLLGMSTLYGDRARTKINLQAYREGEAGLRYAAEKKYGDATKQLKPIRLRWGRVVNRAATTWTPPTQSAAACRKFVFGPGVDKAAAEKCVSEHAAARSLLDRIKADAYYLEPKTRPHLELKVTIQKLAEKAYAFNAENKVWDTEILPKFNAWNKTGG